MSYASMCCMNRRFSDGLSNVRSSPCLCCEMNRSVLATTALVSLGFILNWESRMRLNMSAVVRFRVGVTVRVGSRAETMLNAALRAAWITLTLTLVQVDETAFLRIVNVPPR